MESCYSPRRSEFSKEILDVISILRFIDFEKIHGRVFISPFLSISLPLSFFLCISISIYLFIYLSLALLYSYAHNISERFNLVCTQRDNK